MLFGYSPNQILFPFAWFNFPHRCISTKIMALSFDVNSNLCILTANGTISRATLRHPSSGSVTYEGQYDIIALGGSLLLLSDKSGSSHRSGGLNVSLFGPNGLVQGGVTGGLIAASTTQVVLLSFAGKYCSESELVNQATSSSTPLG
ncbi:putative PPC domain-containing protein [Lupinus albus]|uniref:AT-hook motif nuclear-localized protein n=1 Tax=Lupinus albus TaxID=3870 RepID=A0A6A4MTA8_LUPAL|nr:putative PPC domain-containing protein [Lupinus albus]